MRRAALFVVVLILTGCATMRGSDQLRDGLLTMGIPQASFLEVWGKPDQTYVTSGQDIMEAGWSQGGGNFFKGRQTLEVWKYEARKTEVIFDRRKKLAAWKTNSTVKELAAPAPKAKPE